MKILLCAFGTRGDVQRMLGQGLEQAGFEVSIAAAQKTWESGLMEKAGSNRQSAFLISSSRSRTRL